MYAKNKQGIKNHSIPLQKIIRSQRRRARKGKMKEGTTKQPENNEQNGN